MALVVDSHQHFWDPENGDYGWMQGPDMAPIRHNFWPPQLAPLLAESGVDKTIIVQTWSSLDETRQFLEIAAKTDFVAGVVGWVDMTDPNLAATLAELKAGYGGQYLVGVRHQVHDEKDPDWLLRDDVQRGLQAVQQADLVYDLLTRPRELPAALKTVEQFTDLRFVIDHISKPDIAQGEIDQWATLMEGFRQQPQVWCKLSGMVTEANWQSWRSADLQPYIAKVLDIFGPDRLLYGSDWPVCLLAARYGTVKHVLEENLATLDHRAREKIMGGNAIDVYRLAVVSH